MTFDDFLSALAKLATADCDKCPLLLNGCEDIDNGEDINVPCLAAEMVLTAQRGLRRLYEKVKEAERE